MSIFSKIFVVLVMVLSVLLVALLVPFVINTADYRGQWQQVQSELETEKRVFNAREAAAERRVERAQRETERLRQQITSLENDLNSQNARFTEAQREIIRLQNQNADVRSQLARLSSGLDQAAQVNSILQDEVRERRDGQLRLETRAIELDDALTERTTQVDTLTRQIRLLTEHNTDLERQNEELMASADTGRRAAETGDDAAFDPQNVIRGSVTQIQEYGDQLFVALNVGSSDTVREGMRFTIHRGNTYLGDAVISQVDEETSVGRVTLRRNEITDGAEVVAGLR